MKMRLLLCSMVILSLSCENKNGERNANGQEFSQLDSGSNTTGTRSGNSSSPRDTAGADSDLNPPVLDSSPGMPAKQD